MENKTAIYDVPLRADMLNQKFAMPDFPALEPKLISYQDNTYNPGDDLEAKFSINGRILELEEGDDDTESVVVNGSRYVFRGIRHLQAPGPNKFFRISVTQMPATARVNYVEAMPAMGTKIGDGIVRPIGDEMAIKMGDGIVRPIGDTMAIKMGDGIVRPAGVGISNPGWNGFPMFPYRLNYAEEMPAMAATAMATPAMASHGVGEPFILTFETNPSTGYKWTVEKARNLKVLAKGTYGTAPKGMVGAPLTQYFVVAGEKPGPASLQIAYIQPWERANKKSDREITRVIIY